MKKKTKTEQVRDNPWIVSTFVLVAALMLVLAQMAYDNHQPVVEDTSPSIEKQICSSITGTPTWVQIHEGQKTISVVAQGYNPEELGFTNISFNIVEDVLIPNKIVFVYSSACGWCHKQIEEFGLTWETYQESGLTIDCLEVMK